MKRRLLDLYCGAGGAAMGYHRAGFDIVGVDLREQPRYPFRFVQGNALAPPFRFGDFDAIHASPPCQAHTALKTMWNARQYSDFITATREMLQASGVPWVIENVEGAPLRSPAKLCGTMFDLGVGDAELRRHRLFEASFWIRQNLACHHRKRTIGVYGGGHGVSLHRHAKGQPCFTADQERAAMGIDWMTVDELSQAIPPAGSGSIWPAPLGREPARRHAICLTALACTRISACCKGQPNA